MCNAQDLGQSATYTLVGIERLSQQAGMRGQNFSEILADLEDIGVVRRQRRREQTSRINLFLEPLSFDEDKASLVKPVRCELEDIGYFSPDPGGYGASAANQVDVSEVVNLIKQLFPDHPSFQGKAGHSVAGIKSFEKAMRDCVRLVGTEEACYNILARVLASPEPEEQPIQAAVKASRNLGSYIRASFPEWSQVYSREPLD